jgi:hypothetical protein
LTPERVVQCRIPRGRACAAVEALDALARLTTFVAGQTFARNPDNGTNRVTMRLTSPAFADGAMIPPRYTCDGEGVSPEIEWFDVPDDAVSLALTCVDPDAPRGTFTHWIVWNLDPTRDGLAAGETPPEAGLGRNDFGDIGYGGPCPPRGHGPHRYILTLYALTTALDLPDDSTIAQLRDALDGTTIDRSELIGLFER